jgi:SAM-dependent methyltransferase
MKTQTEWEELPYDERKRLLDISYTYYNQNNFFRGTSNKLETLELIRKFKFKSVLDYGVGQGGLHVWRDPVILKMANDGGAPVLAVLYDPYSKDESVRLKPSSDSKFDIVTCTDVLEHILPEDIDNVLWDLVNYTKKMLHCSVATYPAGKFICDENGKDIFNQSLHTIVKTKRWWIDKFRETEERLYKEQNRWISIRLTFE